MNILLITFQGDVAGSTNSISYLAKGLAERGHTIVIGCRKEALLAELVRGSPVIVEPMTFRGRFDLKNMKQIRDVVKKYSINLINAQSGIDRYNTVFAKWLYRLPVIVVHTRRQYPLSVGGFLQNLIYVKGTDKIVVISDSLKEVFVQKGTPRNHLKVIYNGISSETFDRISESRVAELKAKYGISDSDRVVGCVSRPKKQEQLLQAMVKLDNSIKILFVGVPVGHYDKLVSKLKLKNEIIYAGMVTSEEVMNHYKLLDINVLPSTSEGFGMVLVEAMGAGVPVIATRSQGIVDVLEYGKNGLLFDDGDTDTLAKYIKLVLENKSMHTEMIKKGLEVAHRKFTLENTVKNYELFFQELIES